MSRDRAPQVKPVGPDLREGEIVLRVRERFSFRASLRPGEAKGSKRPRMVGGGLDAPITVHIGAFRRQQVAPSGAGVLKIENLRTNGLKKLSSV